MESAKANKRSATAEILARLESTFTKEDDEALDRDLAEYVAEIDVETEPGVTHHGAGDVNIRLAAVEQQLQQIIGLLQDLKP